MCDVHIAMTQQNATIGDEGVILRTPVVHDVPGGGLDGGDTIYINTFSITKIVIIMFSWLVG